MVKYWKAGDVLTADGLNDLCVIKTYNHLHIDPYPEVNDTNYEFMYFGSDAESIPDYTSTDPKLTLFADTSDGVSSMYQYNTFNMSNADFTVFNALVDPIINGDRAGSKSFIGIKNDHTDIDEINQACFVRGDIINGIAKWYCTFCDADINNLIKIPIPAPKGKTLFSIIWDGTAIYFFVNGDNVITINPGALDTLVRCSISEVSALAANKGSLDVYMFNVETYPN